MSDEVNVAKVRGMSAGQFALALGIDIDLLDLNRDMLAMLEELEVSKVELRLPWPNEPGRIPAHIESFRVCHICDRIIGGHEGKAYMTESAGHDPDCRLAAILKRARGES